MSKTNKAFIENVRELFLDEYVDNRELYHENDIKRIKESDWPIERFTSESEAETVFALVKAMQWRKSFGVHEFTDQHFPHEIYKISEVLQYGADKEGRPIVWLVNKNHNYCAPLETLQKQFLAYQMEKVDRNTSHQGWVLVGDVSDIGISNYDATYSNFVTDLLQTYYPQGIKYMAVVNMPSMFISMSTMMMGSMDEKLRECVKFITKEELANFIDPQFLPIHLGGNYAKFDNEVPNGVKKLSQFTGLGLSSEQIANIYATFKQLNKN